MTPFKYDNNPERIEAAAKMVAHYATARAQLQAERPDLFGKLLDNKARKLALKLGGVALPPAMTVAWATPDGWGAGLQGYRAPLANKGLYLEEKH